MADDMKPDTIHVGLTGPLLECTCPRGRKWKQGSKREGKPWCCRELMALELGKRRGLSNEAMAKALKRTPDAVRVAISTYSIGVKKGQK